MHWVHSENGSDVVVDLNGSKDGRDGSNVELFNNRIKDEDVLHLVRAFTAKGRIDMVCLPSENEHHQVERIPYILP